MCLKYINQLSLPPVTADQPVDVQLLRDQLAALQAKLQSAPEPAREDLVKGAEEELARNSHELLRVTAELERTKEVSRDSHVTVTRLLYCIDW